MKRNRHPKQAVALQKPVLANSDSRVVTVNKTAETECSENTSAVSMKKLNEEDARVDCALEKMKEFSGTKAPSLADRLLLQTTSATLPYWNPSITPGQRLEVAAGALVEMEPSNATEAMLAIQMIATNDAALMFLSRATMNNQNTEIVDANVLRATRLMQVFNEQIEAMHRLKGKVGRQKVTVEHVHVHDGGQAIVGTVTARGSKEGGGG